LSFFNFLGGIQIDSKAWRRLNFLVIWNRLILIKVFILVFRLLAFYNLINFGLFGDFVNLDFVFLLSAEDYLKDSSLETWIELTDLQEVIYGHDGNWDVSRRLNGAGPYTPFLENFSTKYLPHTYLREVDAFSADAVYLALDDEIHILCNLSELYDKFILRNNSKLKILNDGWNDSMILISNHDLPIFDDVLEQALPDIHSEGFR
jgi:hypothetical protein